MQCLLMSRLVNEKFVVTYVESGKSNNHQASLPGRERDGGREERRREG